MTISGIDESQRKAAKIVGLIYLLALIPANFAEFYVSGQLINYDNAAQTATNIMANERLFRWGIAANLLVWILDAVLITALYVVLKPVNPNLALLALVWRIIETVTLVGVTLADLDTLRILSAPEYLRAFEADRLAGLARLAISSHNFAYQIGLLFFGLGSTVFCYLWFKSRYIPRLLGAWGVFASVLIATCTFAFIVFPEARSFISIGYFIPIFIFELVVGFWLLLRGIRTSGIAAASQQSLA